MTPVYSDFLKTFAKIQKETKDLPLEESRIVSTKFFTQNVVKEPIYKLVELEIKGQENPSAASRNQRFYSSGLRLRP